MIVLVFSGERKEGSMGMTVCKTAALLALCCATGAQGPAQAQVRVAATLSNLDYTVTDLAPGDGAAPSVAFDGGTRVALQGRLSEWDGTPPGYLADTNVVVSVPTIVNRSWSDTASTLSWDGRTLIAAATVAPVDRGSVYFSGDAALPWRRFTLAPHTRITFTSSAALDLTLDGATGTPALGYGSMLLEVSPSGGTYVPGAASVYDSLFAWVGDDALRGFNDRTETGRTLTVAWDNDGDTPAQAWVRLEMTADGDAWALRSPVPEPAPWAMLGAGCALVGAWPRLRRRDGV
jgi:hypothetical protein